MTIFVGGALDNVVGRNALGEYERYRAETGRPAKYFTHLSVPGIVGAIREANEAGVPVNVIGHSYGGMAAYNAAKQATQVGLHVDNLVTVDPVGRFAVGKDGFTGEGVGQWTNITAAPHKPDKSDFVAGLGGKAPIRGSNPQSAKPRSGSGEIWPPPGYVPGEQADRNMTVDLNHWNFAGMLRAAGYPGLPYGPGR